MKISDLIAQLETLKTQIGDATVVVPKEPVNTETVPLVEASELLQMPIQSSDKTLLVAFLRG